MAQVIWTEPALDNLDDIAEYIAFHNPSAARKLVKSVFQKTDRLEKFPATGRKPPELQSLGYREIVVNPCRIFYRVDNDTVYILHVMRQEQQLRLYMFNERG